MGDSWWLWALLALVVFWSVGAYNRLVRLRAAALVAFAALDARWQQQIGLIEAALAAREPLSPTAEALRVSAHALSRQWDALRAWPLVLAGMDDLARSRNQVVGHWQALALDAADRGGASDPDGAGGAGGASAMQQHWQQGISECEMLTRQFNAAVEGYNLALAQFPALLIARVFGFKSVEGLTL